MMDSTSGGSAKCSEMLRFTRTKRRIDRARYLAPNSTYRHASSRPLHKRVFCIVEKHMLSLCMHSQGCDSGWSSETPRSLSEAAALSRHWPGSLVRAASQARNRWRRAPHPLRRRYRYHRNRRRSILRIGSRHGRPPRLPCLAPLDRAPSPRSRLAWPRDRPAFLIFSVLLRRRCPR